MFLLSVSSFVHVLPAWQVPGGHPGGHWGRGPLTRITFCSVTLRCLRGVFFVSGSHFLLNGKLRKSMENDGKLWKTIKNDGKWWKSMEKYGKLWKTICLTFWKPVQALRNLRRLKMLKYHATIHQFGIDKTSDWKTLETNSNPIIEQT